MPTSRYELWASHVTARITKDRTDYSSPKDSTDYSSPKDRTDYSSPKALSHPFCWLPNGQLGESAIG